MQLLSRKTQYDSIFPDEPAFRWTQIEQAFFTSVKSWSEVSTIPMNMRQKLDALPWMSVSLNFFQTSKNGDTHKALLTLADGQNIETVLMKNPRGSWTICVSSQVGCAMRCGFCATGKMGLKRNLLSDEIIDQYRFWQTYISLPSNFHSPSSNPISILQYPISSTRISNIVFMGMGEPLANYEEVKAAVNCLLTNTDLGKTRVTVSTVGVLPRLEQILTDKEWPHVRLAVSLHSAIEETRKKIVPTSYDQFLPKLEDWAGRYLALFGNRRHHLTFEYVMLKNVNDTPAHAKALADFVHRIGRVRVNLIPYNLTGVEFERSADSTIQTFLEILNGHDVIAIKRRTMGDDIAAACGQLIVLTQKENSD